MLNILFSKDVFRSYFPKSMITTILENDLEGEEILITHEDVIPEALEILDEFIRGGYLLTPVKNSEMIIKSGRYLLIDLLKIVAQRGWCKFIRSNNFHPLSLVNSQYIITHYRRIITQCISPKLYDLIEYIFDLIPFDTPSIPEHDSELLVKALSHPNLRMIHLLLRRVDPLIQNSNRR